MQYGWHPCFFFFGTLCCCKVDISNHRKFAVYKHASTDKHKSNRKVIASSSLKTFLWWTTLPRDEKISAAELCIAYHAVKLHQSYRSVGCSDQRDDVWKNKRQSFICVWVPQRTCGLHPRKWSAFIQWPDTSDIALTRCFPTVPRYFHFKEGLHYACYALTSFYMKLKCTH